MATKDLKLDLLHSIGLFSRLGRAELVRLGQLADEVDLPADHVLMRQGDDGREAFVIVSGRVTVVRDGRQIAERGPGDVIGEISLLSKGPRTATVTTAEPCRLFVIGRREFQALMEEQPSIRLAMLEELAYRLRVLETDAVN